MSEPVPSKQELTVAAPRGWRSSFWMFLPKNRMFLPIRQSREGLSHLFAVSAQAGLLLARRVVRQTLPWQTLCREGGGRLALNACSLACGLHYAQGRAGRGETACVCVCTVQTIPVAASSNGCHMEQHAEDAWLAGSGQRLILTMDLS